MFELLQEHLLFTKERKCVFFVKRIQYFGHIISVKGMWMDPEKVDAILKWLKPKNLQELQIFLGMLGFYQSYVKYYKKISIPISFCNQRLQENIYSNNQLQSNSKEITLGEALQRSFEKLKVALAVALILDIVDPNKPFLLEIDASGEAIRAILMQGGCPVAFESKELNCMQ